MRNGAFRRPPNKPKFRRACNFACVHSALRPTLSDSSQGPRRCPQLAAVVWIGFPLSLLLSFQGKGKESCFNNCLRTESPGRTLKKNKRTEPEHWIADLARTLPVTAPAKRGTPLQATTQDEIRKGRGRLARHLRMAEENLKRRLTQYL